MKCSYRNPTDKSKELDPIDLKWVELHCNISKYCLQITKYDDFSCCGQLRSNIRATIKERFLPRSLLLKRSSENGIQLANIGEESVKVKNIYTNLLQSMAFSHLKPTVYEQVELPCDLFCPSVQKKIKEKGGSRYHCSFVTCRKIFTTLELVKLHLKLTGHKKLAMKAIQEDDNTKSESDTEQIEDALFNNIESFLHEETIWRNML